MVRHENRNSSLWMLSTGLVVILLVAGCFLSESPVDAEAPADSGKVVAQIGDTPITMAEVEEQVADQLLALDRQRHQLIEQGLTALLEQRLLEIEAESKGVSREELVAQEVEGKLGEPTEAEIDKFYEDYKSRINQPKEAVVENIKTYLTQAKQQEAYQNYVKSLEDSYGVKRMLDPMRTQVATGDSPSMGPSDAPVTIVEFSDFECPYCARVNPTLEQVREEYGESVRLVFRQFPLPIHANAKKAAEAALCAGDQGKFWEMHDAMFADQKNLGVDALKEKASGLELDGAAFAECLDSGKHAGQVETDLADGRKAGVTGTPALFINGRFLSGAQPFETVAAIIDEELEGIK